MLGLIININYSDKIQTKMISIQIIISKSIFLRFQISKYKQIFLI